MADDHTPGPWAWMGSGDHGIYLATTHSGRRYVMGFRRMGLQAAQPVFQVNSRMVPSSELLQFEVGNRDVRGIQAAKADGSVYRYDVRGIDCPDARLIAAAPELLDALRRARGVLGDYITAAGEPDDTDAELLREIDAAIEKATQP